MFFWFVRGVRWHCCWGHRGSAYESNSVSCRVCSVESSDCRKSDLRTSAGWGFWFAGWFGPASFVGRGGGGAGRVGQLQGGAAETGTGMEYVGREQRYYACAAA